MRLYRATFKDRDGKTRKAPCWYVEVRDANGRTRRVRGFTDKGATHEFGTKLRRLAANGEVQGVTDPGLTAWVEHLPADTRARLARLGFLDSRRAARSRPISELLEEFKATLRTRERTEDWIRHVVFRARVTFEGAGFVTLSNIEPGAIERHLHALRAGTVQPKEGALARRRKPKEKDAPPPIVRLSARESNHRVQACREFTRWAMASKLLSSDPLLALSPMNAEVDPRHSRRALRPEELRNLVTAAHNGSTFRGVRGDVRALAWRLAAQAGLRVGEIQALQVRHVDLMGPEGPTLTVSATVSKNRTEARVPLAADLARDLAPWLRGKLPTATVLPLPPSFMHKAAAWLRVDLASAKIPYRDDSGRCADVHALRSAFVAQLVRSGANVKAIQRLARHKSVGVTIGLYARLDARDERDAIDAFPSLAPDSTSTQGEALRPTGTDTADCLAPCLADPVAAARIPAPLGASRSGADARENRAARTALVAVEGFEPPTHGL